MSVKSKLRYALLAGAVLVQPGLGVAQAGGSMTVTYQSDVATLDPAIGYDWQNWSMIKSLFDGLIDYEPGNTTIVADLAESFDIAPDGLTYTFHLRQGVKFHNGREMTAEDVKYSLERTVNPATQSPGASYYDTILGYAEVAGGSASELSGVKVIDPYTLTIELSRPDAPFLHKLALNFAFVVPKEAVEEYGADFGKHPVGTGAFRLADWTLGQHVIFERNPDYYIADRPRLDQIVFEIGQDPSVALLRLERGEVDLLGDGIPPARFVDVMNNPDLRPLVVQGGQLHTGYVTLNTRVPPLDNVKVRQALNMAINKERIVQIINGRAVVANQALPPAMPGYGTTETGYPYDPEKAKALLAEAGFPDGFASELYAANIDPNPRIAQAIQQDLAEIGVKVEIKALDPSVVIGAGGTEGGAPMVWSGGMAWIADFPDPSNFYWAILGCGAAAPGGWNWSWYCSEPIDALAGEADALADPAQAQARLDMWTEIFAKVLADAPWIPIFNEERFTMHSARIAADTNAIFVDPVHIPVHYDVVFATDAQ
ncbi:MAG: ABC transporter substrate-binding protein [Alphaproteobacteria bacterium]